MITIDKFKETFNKKEYIWHIDRPNIIGIRTSLQLPDVFNDILFMEYEGKTFISTAFTTEPGIAMLSNPINDKGTALLVPNQYKNCWSLGFHKQRKEHRALVQVDVVSVYRDSDKDNLAEITNVTDKGLFGINIHGTRPDRLVKAIGEFSAGCQVFHRWEQKEDFIDILYTYKDKVNNKFTYTLLLEEDLK